MAANTKSSTKLKAPAALKDMSVNVKMNTRNASKRKLVVYQVSIFPHGIRSANLGLQDTDAENRESTSNAKRGNVSAPSFQKAMATPGDSEVEQEDEVGNDAGEGEGDDNTSDDESGPPITEDQDEHPLYEEDSTQPRRPIRPTQPIRPLQPTQPVHIDDPSLQSYLNEFSAFRAKSAKTVSDLGATVAKREAIIEQKKSERSNLEEELERIRRKCRDLQDDIDKEEGQLAGDKQRMAQWKAAVDWQSVLPDSVAL